MSALEVRGLCAGYGGADVVAGVDLTVGQGEIVVILGANGAGKTTLMRAVSGTISRRGSVLVEGVDVSSASPDVIVRRGLAQVPQGRGTIADLTVEDNLWAGAYIRKDRREIAADLDHWYSVYPRLAERRTQRAGLLSGGEQQMLAVARAMMSRPAVLLCDEPSLGLSPKLTADLFASLKEISTERGMAMLIVEQNATVALGVATRGYLIEVGRVSRSRSAADLVDDDAVRAAYLGA